MKYNYLKSKGGSCDACDRFRGRVARVFESESAFRRSEFYGGGDRLVNDPNAEFAVWSGKSNVGRRAADYHFCTPLHPNCGDTYHDHQPQSVEDEHTDWWNDPDFKSFVA